MLASNVYLNSLIKKTFSPLANLVTFKNIFFFLNPADQLTKMQTFTQIRFLGKTKIDFFLSLKMLV